MLHQSNGATVELHIDQMYPTGDGSESEPLAGRALVRGMGMVSNRMTGRTKDNTFFLVITWNQGSVGEYHGTFNGNRLSGVTFDRSHPESQATWFIDKDFRSLW
jgi:hypothetical protein